MIDKNILILAWVSLGLGGPLLMILLGIGFKIFYALKAMKLKQDAVQLGREEI